MEKPDRAVAAAVDEDDDRNEEEPLSNVGFSSLPSRMPIAGAERGACDEDAADPGGCDDGDGECRSNVPLPLWT